MRVPLSFFPIFGLLGIFRRSSPSVVLQSLYKLKLLVNYITQYSCLASLFQVRVQISTFLDKLF